MSLKQHIYDLFDARGYDLRRHPAARRVRMLAASNVDRVFDVGAAKGAYGQQLRRYGYRGRIISFEPLPSSFEMLRHASAGDEAWAIEPYGLSDTTGNATLHVTDNSDSSSLLPMLDTHVAAAPDIAVVGTMDVRLETLDAVAPSFGGRDRTFLKIDVQGAERKVLAGAQRTVESSVGIQLELSFVPLYEGSMLADEAISWAYGHGFSLVGVEPGFMDGDQMVQADGVFIRL